MKSIFTIIAAAFLLVVSAPSAEATNWLWEWDGTTGHTPTLFHNDGAGVLTDFGIRYDDVNQNFRMNAGFDRNPGNGNLPEGFWVVITDGQNPKNVPNGQYAALYGDFANNRITSYVYTRNGRFYNGGNITNPNFVQSIENAMVINQTADSIDFSLNMQVNDINSFSTDPNWNGIGFDDEVGIWFHPRTTFDITYNPDGTFASFDLGRGYPGYLDTRDSADTTAVPEPATLAMMGMGLAGAGLLRRKKNT